MASARPSPRPAPVMTTRLPDRLRSSVMLLRPRQAIGAAPCAAKDMLLALDVNVRAEDIAEQAELGAAEALAGLGRDADRAVILDQQHVAVGQFPGLGHV